MKQKIITGMCVMILIILEVYLSFHTFTTVAAQGNKLFVDDNYNATTPGWGEDHFNSIQSAIDKALDNYTIIVYNGTYNEILTIRKPLTIIGENQSSTIINGGGAGEVITINTSYVNISHFTIKNGNRSTGHAVITVNADRVILYDNCIKDGYHGVELSSSDNSILYKNIITGNNGDGLHLIESSDNNILYNTINNNLNGLFLYKSNSNNIRYNRIAGNNMHGVFFNDTCNSNNLSLNTIMDNDMNGLFLLNYCTGNIIGSNEISLNIGSGVKIENSSFNNISLNTIDNNIQYGLLITGSSNIFYKNKVSSNMRDGVFLLGDTSTNIIANTIQGNVYDGVKGYKSSSGTIRGNMIYGNKGRGVFLDMFTKDNRIYDNRIYNNNQRNTQDESITNTNIWNTSKNNASCNIINGSYLGGNYYDDYTGVDSNGDGLGDTPYQVYGTVYDKLPLVDVTPPTITNVNVNPSVQTTQGYVNISAYVTDDLYLYDVRLIVIYPNKQTFNYSIKQNKTGNTYYCRRNFNIVGEYTYNIKATDRRNWRSSSNKTFIIQQGIPPTITDNTPTSGSPFTFFVFNATVVDDTDKASDLTVKVNLSHGKLKGNISMVNTVGDYFELSVLLDKSVSDLTYFIYASDRWGNAFTTSEKTVSIIDTKPPCITVTRYGPSFSQTPNSFTYRALITDDVSVKNVTIGYWYNGSGVITATMDKKTNDYYEKVIVLPVSISRLYCIIRAEDTSGNYNDTRNPSARLSSASYKGVVSVPVEFKGYKSFDLDGDIVDYTWDFGDGSTSAGVNTTHIYTATGNYTLKLTVKDNEGRKGVNTTTVRICSLVKKYCSTLVLNRIKTSYNITLNEPFCTYDSDGDNVYDVFVDPNGLLSVVHDGSINLSGNISFLISIDDALIPEFIWSPTTDNILRVNHTTGRVTHSVEEGNNATTIITVNKTSGWLFIETNDQYPHANITVERDTGVIPDDRIFRKEERIFILDDPALNYTIRYSDILTPPVLSITLSPAEGGLIDKDNPSITITCNLPVRIKEASFGSLPISPDEFITTDHKVFVYTPPSDLEDKTYTFYILVEDDYGNTAETGAVYFYFSYAVISEGKTTDVYIFPYILIGVCISIIIVFYLLVKYKKISFDDYIYIKNKRIIPFFKPLILGPVSIKVDNEGISKAEFYVDGALKKSVEEPPFQWEWDERVFLKHTIETRVYDEEGNSTSTGEIPIYIFNPWSKTFKE
ncbi:MAG: NosD domain-containing protein [Candidatus Thermoplasmatota archaeon]